MSLAASTLELRSNAEIDTTGVTLCAFCHVNPAKRKFCSPKCSNAFRQAEFRERHYVYVPCRHCGKKYAKIKFCSNECRTAFYNLPRVERKIRWNAACEPIRAQIRRHKTMEFDGRTGGGDNVTAGSLPLLGSFPLVIPQPSPELLQLWAKRKALRKKKHDCPIGSNLAKWRFSNA